MHDGKSFEEVVVVFENFDDIEKCEFSISYPVVFSKIFKSKTKLREIEALIIKEILESVPYAKPKNLANYHEKIFDFLSNRYEYSSKFVDINKAYLGQNVENIYNLLLKENYNFGEETQIQPIQNVFTFETYENLLKKFEKYGIKKLNLNIEIVINLFLVDLINLVQNIESIALNFLVKEAKLIMIMWIIGQIKSN
ncbi:Uncharacterised protein (plasmid) [Mesomycoplasma ovipneumoniae]|nr:Uncharacterised protein [Mesomycoplasma ovipneumoniae]